MANMFALITGMGIMTSDAASSLFPVHMKKMEVIFFIPEISQFSSFSCFGNIFIMATKTKIVFLRFIFVIKIFRKISNQKTTEFRTVNIMTLRTGTCFYRTMEVLTISYFFSQLYMTGTAEIYAFTLEQGSNLGTMGYMAFSTLALCYWLMLKYSCVNGLIDVR